MIYYFWWAHDEEQKGESGTRELIRTKNIVFVGTNEDEVKEEHNHICEKYKDKDDWYVCPIQSAHNPAFISVHPTTIPNDYR